MGATYGGYLWGLPNNSIKLRDGGLPDRLLHLRDGGYLWGLPNNSLQLRDGGYLRGLPNDSMLLESIK